MLNLRLFANVLDALKKPFLKILDNFTLCAKAQLNDNIIHVNGE
jgi:hypothetical protein